MSCKKCDTGYRSFIVGLDTKVPLKNGKVVTAINFDNAATTPPFVSVMKALNSFAPWYSSIHRGTGYKSQLCSNVYENSRNTVLDFVGGDKNYDTVIYVKNTTEAINKLSYRLCKKHGKCVILSTDMEHHSNDLPWRDKFDIDYVSIYGSGKLHLDELEDKLKNYNGKVDLVAITGASNVTGYINPIYEAAKIAHRYGAKILVDAAQLVPHSPVNIKPYNSPEHIDFLAFSAHKMYAPFGIGVLIGPKDSFDTNPPEFVGGGTIKFVTHGPVIWEDVPNKEEAGTPNVMGVVALVEAIKTLSLIGMDTVKKVEEDLTDYCLKRLHEIPDISIYGNPIDSSDRIAIIPFNLEGMRHDVLAKTLSYESGIAVRHGCFCAHPYIQKLLNVSPEEINLHLKDTEAPSPGMVRVSFGLYNTHEEIDIFIETLKVISQYKDYYNKKYK